MDVLELNIQNLAVIDFGRWRLTGEALLQELLADLYDRAQVDKARVLTAQLTLRPTTRPETPTILDGVDIECEFRTKRPGYRTGVTPTKPRKIYRPEKGREEFQLVFFDNTPTEEPTDAQ